LIHRHGETHLLTVKSVKDETLELVFWLSIGAGVIYFLTKAAGGVASLTNPLSTAAANAFVNLTAGPAVQATGNITMPDGSTIPASAITMTNMSTNQFSYGGQTYTLSEDSSGNYVAN
jgi:hypothetical protein